MREKFKDIKGLGIAAENGYYFCPDAAECKKMLLKDHYNELTMKWKKPVIEAIREY